MGYYELITMERPEELCFQMGLMQGMYLKILALRSSVVNNTLMQNTTVLLKLTTPKLPQQKSSK